MYRGTKHNSFTVKKIICAVLAVLTAVTLLGAAGCNKNKGGKGEFAGKVDGLNFTRPVFMYAFNYAANKLYQSGEVSFDTFGTDEFVDLLKETKNADGKSYYDAMLEDILLEGQKYLINEKLARGGSDWPDDSTLKTKGENLKTSLESDYAMYIQYYGYTVEMIALQLFGMPLSDYMDIYPRTEAVDAYNTEWMRKLDPTEEQLAQFYADHTSEYRIVTVRHSLILTEDMTADEKQEALAEAQGYVDAVKNGTMTFDEVVALSEDTGVTSNDGYYDVYENSGFVKPFEEWAVACTETTTVPEIVETEFGYHLMICTGIKDYTDDDVRNNVNQGWRADQLDKELNKMAAQSEHAIKDRSDAVIEKYMKMALTVNFDEPDPDDPDATAAPDATATPKPEYNDDPLDDTVVARVGEQTIIYPEFVFMFSTAVNEILTDDYTPDSSATTAERYQQLREFLDTPYKDSSMTYLEKIKARAQELAVEYAASYMMALEHKTPYTEEELAAMNDEIDEAVDYYLMYAGEYYGATTRDEYMRYVTGMGVNDYKYFNAIHTFLSEYAEEAMAAMTVTDEQLKAYYDANVEYYRVVAVRHIRLDFTDTDEDETISDAEKQAVRDTANSLVTKINTGDSPEALVKAWSQAEDATTSGGIVTLSAVSGALDREIIDWAIENTTIGTETLTVFEFTDGIEVVYVCGILTYDGLEGETGTDDVTPETLRSTLESAYKNEEYDRQIKQYVTDHSLELAELRTDLVDKAAEAYLTYEDKTVTE
jgi:hypothetical protein